MELHLQYRHFLIVSGVPQYPILFQIIVTWYRLFLITVFRVAFSLEIQIVDSVMLQELLKIWNTTRRVEY